VNGGSAARPSEPDGIPPRCARAPRCPPAARAITIGIDALIVPKVPVSNFPPPPSPTQEIIARRQAFCENKLSPSCSLQGASASSEISHILNLCMCAQSAKSAIEREVARCDGLPPLARSGREAGDEITVSRIVDDAGSRVARAGRRARSSGGGCAVGEWRWWWLACRGGALRGRPAPMARWHLGTRSGGGL
jgi:hypothetical protein